MSATRTPRNFYGAYNASSLIDYLAGRQLDLAVCWKLTPAAGSPAPVLGATSHTRNLTLQGHPGVTFKSTNGIVPTAVDAEVGQNSGGLEVEAGFDDAAITPLSIARGDWDSASFEIFMINFKAPTMGELIQFSGKIGEITREGKRFRAEGRPLTHVSQTRVGYLYTKRCQARFLGDPDCTVNLAAPAAGDGGTITVTGTVGAGSTNEYFFDTSRTEADGYFANGRVTFGGTVNKTIEIASWDAATKKAILQLPLFTILPVGTPYTMYRGCDFSDGMCRVVYNNLINIVRAFPYVPMEKALRIKRVS